MSNVLAIDSSDQFIAFPFYDGTYSRVRVVDLEAGSQSQVIASTDPLSEGNSMNSYGNVAVHSVTQETFTVTVALAFSFAHTVFTSFTIRPASRAYVFPQANTASSNKLISLQLEAFNGLSKAVAPVFSVNFTA